MNMVGKQFCSSSAVVEIRLVKFNSSGILTNKKCCDATRNPCPANQCDPLFVFCLQDFSGHGCSLGNITTGYVANKDTITFSDVIGDTRTGNPIRMHVSKYPGVVIAKVTVYDDDTHESGVGAREKMDYMQYVYTFAPDKNGTHGNVNLIPLRGSTSTLDIEIGVHCDMGYYGNKCDVKCQSDYLHYCDENGQTQCRPGKDCSATVSRPSSTVQTTTRTPTPSTEMVTRTVHSTSASFSHTLVPPSQTVIMSTRRHITSTRVITKVPTNLSEPSPNATLDLQTSTQRFHTDTLQTPITTTPMPTMNTNQHTDDTSQTQSIYTRDIGYRSTSAHATPSTIPFASSSKPSTPVYGCIYNVTSVNKGIITMDLNDTRTFSQLKSFVMEYTMHQLDYLNDTLHINFDVKGIENSKRQISWIVSYDQGGPTVNTSVIELMFQTFCSHVTARPYRSDKGDDSDTVTIIVPAVIVGLIALLSLPAIYFLCKRKCKKRQIDTEQTTGIKPLDTTQGTKERVQKV